MSKERRLIHFGPTFLDASLRQVGVCVSTVTFSVFSTDFTPFVLLHSEPRLLFQSLLLYPLIQARQKGGSDKDSETAPSSIFHFGQTVSVRRAPDDHTATLVHRSSGPGFNTFLPLQGKQNYLNWETMKLPSLNISAGLGNILKWSCYDWA